MKFSEPHDRLTRLCEVMTKALEADPEYRDGDKVVIMLDDGQHGGIELSGYDDEAAAIVDINRHLKAIFEANGKTLPGHFPVRAICGSLRYREMMLEVAQSQTAAGVIILMPYVADYMGGQPADARKQMLDEMHRAKIGMSECIIVVGSHIGESTTSEIEYARETGKPVYYWDAKTSGLK